MIEHLHSDLLRKCWATARARNEKPKHTNRQASRRPGHELHFDGLRAEAGLAQFLGNPDLVDFSVHLHGDGGSDMLLNGRRMQVKASTYTPPLLRFDIEGSQKFSADHATLVYVPRSPHQPDDRWCQEFGWVDLIGWIARDEFMQRAKLMNFGYGERLVVAPPLCPMSLLLPGEPMPFSQEQVDALNAPLSRSNVKGRAQAGRNVSYLEGWFVLAEANRIFGFDRWSSETIETRCVVERDRLIGKSATPGWSVTYNARVRISVYTDSETITRDGCGSGHGIDIDLGQAHESAIKEAETDARKRALVTFGNQFGLALYDKEQTNVADEPTARELYIFKCEEIIEKNSHDPKALVEWWRSQHDARRDLLNPADIIRLKNLVTSKLPTKTSEEQVA